MKIYKITFSYKSSREDDSVLVEAPSSSEALRRIMLAWDAGTEIYNVKIVVENIFQIVTNDVWSKYEANKAS